jgi:chromosome partitioning protein
MGKIISFLNPKGGVGKSTCTQNFSLDFCKKGLSVLAIDSDPQQTLNRYFSKLDEHPPVVTLEDSAGLDKKMLNLKKRYDFIFLDGESKVLLDASSEIDKRLLKIICVSDMVVIPVQPSGLDMDGLDILCPLLKKRQSVNQGTPVCVFLINADMPSTHLSRGIGAALKKEFGFPILKHRISRSVHHVEALMRGSPIVDSKTTWGLKLAREIHEVSQELMEFINEKK